MLGGGRNAFSKYERGEVAQSVAMDRIIRVCQTHPSLLV
ncbi:type II toxin-antitoxin system MqsA family antitoxin [Marinobacterium sp. MBR-109]|jgi:HTH-type transcriptional regulator/antitoxin MqsA